MAVLWRDRGDDESIDVDVVCPGAAVVLAEGKEERAFVLEDSNVPAKGVSQPGSGQTACGTGAATCEQCASQQACLNGKCATQTQNCGPATCDGCCDSHDFCQPGDSTALCGATGGACVTCGTGRDCVAGSCTCTANSCPTGCCQGDQCMSGIQQSACGNNGGACKVCSGADKCVSGTCSSDCGATSCVGCCQNNVCKGGSDPAACGSNGSSCSACSSGQQCVNGTCNSASTCNATNCAGCCKAGVCQGGTTDGQCGKGGAVCSSCKWFQNCSSQKCAFDPTSEWFVDLAEVKLVDTKAWDVWPDDPKPDTFVDISSGTASHTTATIDNNYVAAFNEYLFYVSAQSLMAQIAVTIQDQDTFFNDTICDFTDVIYQSEIEGGTATIYYPCPDVEYIKFKFY